MNLQGDRPMKNKIKLLLRWAGAFILCLIVIYLFVFFGGWKLFESGDPFLIEIGIAFVLSIFLFGIDEVIIGLEKRVKSLEERVNELEKKE